MKPGMDYQMHPRIDIVHIESWNPQRDPTEIIIEIKQFNPGRMASHPFIESYRRYMVFPLRDTFTIKNGLLD